jgi:hypothetical protein
MNSDGNKFYMKIVDFDEIYEFQMKKVWTKKILNLVESYKFYIEFTSIRVYTKKLQLFGNELTPTAVW